MGNINSKRDNYTLITLDTEIAQISQAPVRPLDLLMMVAIPCGRWRKLRRPVRRLEDSKLGFDLFHSRGGQVVEQRIPGLIYADDVVFIAENAVDLQRLADICGEEYPHLGLSFRTVKSGIMRFDSEENGATVSLQQEVLPAVKNYKYLGVTISDTEDYLDDHKEHLRLKGRRNASLMKHRAL